MSTDDVEHWIGTWSVAPQSAHKRPARYVGQTLRLILRSSVGGEAARVRVSNTFGTTSLEIGSAYIAYRAEGAAIAPGTSRQLTFDGHTSVTVAPGEDATSDGADLMVEPLTDLAVSLYLPRPTRAWTDHFPAQQTGYVTRPGPDASGNCGLPFAAPLMSWPLLTGVDVKGQMPGRAAVALGDSIVDGAASTRDTHRRWSDLLAVRVQQGRRVQPIAILNCGNIGNRLLYSALPDRPLHGAPGIVRFKHEVVAQVGVKYAIVSFGVNDIGFGGSLAPSTEKVTAVELIEGFIRVAKMARENGIMPIGCTISPFEGALCGPGFYTLDKEQIRVQVNQWIRTSQTFDHVVDFDAVLRAPEHPSRLNKKFDSGDHLHPNDAGHQAMAEVFDLGIFE